MIRIFHEFLLLDLKRVQRFEMPLHIRVDDVGDHHLPYRPIGDIGEVREDVEPFIMHQLKGDCGMVIFQYLSRKFQKYQKKPNKLRFLPLHRCI